MEQHKVTEKQKLLNKQGNIAEPGYSTSLVWQYDRADIKAKKIRIKEFSGKEIYGSNFDINIDVMQGLVDSKLAESQMWDTLLMNGGIQNMDPEILEMYINVNPTVTQHTKHALKAVIERQKQSENYQLKQQLAKAIQSLQQMSNYAKELEAQSEYRKNYAENLMKEFTQKIGVANKLIGAQNQMISGKASNNQVTEGAGKSLNSRGISGSDITTDTQ